MDPAITLRDVDQAISDNEWSAAVDGLRAYWHWRSRNGAEPTCAELTAAGLGATLAGDNEADKLGYRLADALMSGAFTLPSD